MEVHMAQVVGGVTDPEELLATILHDIVEDSDVTPGQLATEYSPRVAAIVKLVSKPEPFIPEIFYGSITKASSDIGVPAMRIKARDRINNLITNMAHNRPEIARAYIKEARRYFMPMAEKVGLTEELDRTIRHVIKIIAGDT
jgi:(p)ppGpp synthase/HD superfamily hydrolase